MGDPVRNRCDPASLNDADVAAALERIGARDAERGRDARHVYDTLTWGEGPAMITQSAVQDWLWYRLPTKYMTDEVGYMGRLAGIAAELFDELGLDAYAALCRSETTVGVHDAFERSDSSGFDAMRNAQVASGIDPPDLDDFEWGQLMGLEEANARSAVELALEDAIADGRLVVGGRSWRIRQREVTALALEADHPSQPGQTWRTAIVTERLGTWADEPSRRSETLGRLRAQVANRLLHPIAAPDDIAERLAPLTWLLAKIGDEQPLTQAGYLTPAFVRQVHAEQPWEEPFPIRGTPRTESDAITLSRVRTVLESIGAVRRRRAKLQRTTRGAAMVSDAAAAWTALIRRPVTDEWDRFAVHAVALVLLDSDVAMLAEDVAQVVAGAGIDLGWRTTGHDGVDRDPTARDVQWAFSDTAAMLRLFGMLDEQGDWRERRWILTPAGTTTMLGVLSESATGPRARPQ